MQQLIISFVVAWAGIFLLKCVNKISSYSVFTRFSYEQTWKNLEAPCLLNHQDYCEEPSGIVHSETTKTRFIDWGKILKTFYNSPHNC